MNATGKLRLIFGALAVLTLGGGGVYGTLPLSVDGLKSELAAKPKSVRTCIGNQLSEADTEQTVNRFSLRRMVSHCSRT